MSGRKGGELMMKAEEKRKKVRGEMCKIQKGGDYSSVLLQLFYQLRVG